MTTPAPEFDDMDEPQQHSRRGRHREEGLYVTDAEIGRRLNVPEKIGRRAIRDLEKQAPGRPKFPAKDPLFGERRFWPAVRKYFMLRNGVTDAPFLAAPYRESINETGQTGETERSGNTRSDVETPREILDRVLAAAARPRRGSNLHGGKRKLTPRTPQGKDEPKS